MLNSRSNLIRITVTFVARREDAGNSATPRWPTPPAHPPGEFVSVVGPTGCGKSTLLNIGAGLLEPSAGHGDGVRRAAVKGINRRAGYMFQTEALMPWRSAIDNVMVGLQYRGVRRRRGARQAQAWLERVGLGGFGDRYPHQLSGGMRKRTALAQVLALDPDIILMDEPFSALDIQTRQLMENEVLDLWAAKKQGRAVHHPRPGRSDRHERPGRGAVGRARPHGRSASSTSTCRGRATWPRCAPTRAFVELHTQIWAVLRDEVLKGYRAAAQEGRLTCGGPETLA
jgi:NitT/TauT family transport system ATP-binding protein